MFFPPLFLQKNAFTEKVSKGAAAMLIDSFLQKFLRSVA